MKKGFYASLAVGVIAITAVGIIAAQNTGSQEQPEHLAQIENEAAKAPEKTPDGNLMTPVPAPAIQGPQTPAPMDTAKPQSMGNGNLEGTGSSQPEKETGTTPDRPKEVKPQEEKAPQVSQVMSGADSIKKLSFKEEDGLIWPVLGDVLLKYSMDHSIYFKTLAQYKYNPALVIAAKEDTEVLSAARCVVTEISENEETGVTLTATLGDGYEVVYGQLKEVKVQIGDTIEKGSVLGKIAEPTKYYIEEGSNLYFEVLEDGTPVDPLLLLE